MKTLSQIWLLVLLMQLSSQQFCDAQSKPFNRYDLNIGLSTADALNFGMRYHFRQNAVGINIGGGLPARGFWQVISSISIYRHLWGQSRFTEVMPWYAKAALHYDYSESQLTRTYVSGTRLAGARLYMGRDFNVSSRLACSAAAGPMIIFYNYWYGNQRLRPRAVAGLDLMIFYRL